MNIYELKIFTVTFLRIFCMRQTQQSDFLKSSMHLEK